MNNKKVWVAIPPARKAQKQRKLARRQQASPPGTSGFTTLHHFQPPELVSDTCNQLSLTLNLLCLPYSLQQACPTCSPEQPERGPTQIPKTV